MYSREMLISWQSYSNDKKKDMEIKCIHSNVSELPRSIFNDKKTCLEINRDEKVQARITTLQQIKF